MRFSVAANGDRQWSEYELMTLLEFGSGRRSGTGTRDRFSSVFPAVASKTVEDVLFPGIDVRVERVNNSSGLLVVEAVSTGRPGRCPDCRKQASRVHSTYQRTLDERPLGLRRVVVRLRVRRYFCDRKRCSRKTFAEQVPGLSERHRRSSTGLTEWLRSIAVELSGRPAARLCRRLRLAAGRTRLLRLLTAPAVPDRAPRVLGVDEFAFRKGCTYGTVLVDVEAGRVVDVLPDRTAETFAAWLRDHPGAEIICRDRATAYTKADKEAAPGALEVADRWHLLQNLSAAVEKTCHQHRDCLRKHVNQEATVPEPVPMELPAPELPRTQIIERTRHRYEDIHGLVEKGWTISAIARRLNLDRKTVRRFRDTALDELLGSARDRRPNGVLEPFKAYLNARFTETQGQASGTRLFQEIRERGYQGSRQVVRKHLAALRAGTAEPVRADIPSPRKITSWIMRPRETLTESQDQRLLQVRLACPDITRACDLARTFADLVRHRRGFLLLEWIRQAEKDAPKPMKSLAGSLRQDLDAVTAGLTLPWSSGVVEGHVNRVKTLKRAMYGRASYELLRTRILIQP
ncbi:ISL3 family transposase [Streptomyces celluloflavus]|uniref:ISL3 family transposase n=1 Tax=Streptomyces celluloflavus TaxID=58344 RepID=A0ABW7RJH8_9ACTN